MCGQVGKVCRGLVVELPHRLWMPACAGKTGEGCFAGAQWRMERRVLMPQQPSLSRCCHMQVEMSLLGSAELHDREPRYAVTSADGKSTFIYNQ